MTHWKKLKNPNYLGSWDFQPKQEIILTISNIKNEIVIGSDGKKEECTVAFFKEKQVDGIQIKPFILNTTNCKTIEKVYGTSYIEQWIGNPIQLYIDRIKAFGDVVDALRIRKFKPKIITSTETLICEKCKDEITAKFGKTAQQLAAYTAKKYGKMLCDACAILEKNPEDETSAAEEIDILNETEEKQDASNAEQLSQP